MVDLKNLKKVKSVDIEQFNGVKSKIDEVKILDPEKKNFGDGEVEVCQLRVMSEKLNEEGDPIRAGEYIALKKDSESGEWGIPDNSNAKAMKFLSYFKVDNFEDLIGKECLVVKRVKGDRSFLGINHG